MDIDFAIDEINREQDRWNLLEAELEAAEKRVAELENDPTSEWRAACLEREHFNDALKKRVAKLESNLNAANERASRWEAAWEDIWDYAERKINQALLFYDKYRQEKKRVAELEYFNAELKITIDERDLWITTDTKRIAELEEACKMACAKVGEYYEQESYDEAPLFKATEILLAVLNKDQESQ